MSEDAGILDETTWDDGLYKYFGTCEAGSVSSDISMAAGVSARGSTQEEWNEIAYNGSNIWEFFCHFTDLPESLLLPGCSSEEMLGVDPVTVLLTP